MKQKRYFKTIVCLILGAVLLTGSALANYENASGYTKLKNGILNMLTVENFSAEVNYSLNINGAVLDSQQAEYKYDRNGSTSEYTKNLNSDYSSEYWIQDGFGISKHSDSYSVYPAYSKGFNDDYLSGTKEDNDMADKMVSFAELLCDTLVGDLKNNFVLVSTENGLSTYQIDLGKEQIPELIQLGLNLMFSSYSSGGYTTYEEYDDSKTDEEWEALYEETDGVLAEHDYEGVVYVRKDGTIEYFATEGEFYQATGNVDATDLNSLYSLFYSDPSISGASCTATLDSEGRLSYIKASGILSGKDKNGNEQSATLDFEFNFHDYGTTSIEPFDKSLLDFNWTTPDDEYHYYEFDSEGNIIEYDNYQYDEYGNIVVEDGELSAEGVPAAVTSDSDVADSSEETDADSVVTD